MLAYNPKNITEDEREHLLTTVGQAHAGLAEVALKLRLGLPPKTPALKTAIKAERVAFDLKRSLQRLEAEALGFQRAFLDIGPANVKGLEINPYAAELARVSIWIGEIQWMRRNGFYESQNPILKPLDTIECRDAILAPDSAEPDWPKADVVIVADPKGVIVAGETRYKAAVSLGWTSAPVVTIPARQVRAFRLVDNRTSELTSWDTDLLPDELAGLDDLEIFSFDDVLSLPAKAGKTDPDDIPETPKNPVTRTGDLWVLGEHRVVCGDSTDHDTVERLLDGAEPYLMVTDPPYGVGYDSSWRYKAGISTKDGAFGKSVNDDNSD